MDLGLVRISSRLELFRGDLLRSRRAEASPRDVSAAPRAGDDPGMRVRRRRPGAQGDGRKLAAGLPERAPAAGAPADHAEGERFVDVLLRLGATNVGRYSREN